MALTEHKTKAQHYFTDKQGRYQGEYSLWHDNGQPCEHYFYVDGKRVIDFIEEPDTYPKTPEERTFFNLTYGSGKLLDIQLPMN